MRTRREICAYALLTLLAPFLAWLGNPTAHASHAVARHQAAKAGEWQGQLGNLRLLVKIDRSADGSPAGKITSVDQSNVTIPIDPIPLPPFRTQTHLDHAQQEAAGKNESPKDSRP